MEKAIAILRRIPKRTAAVVAVIAAVAVVPATMFAWGPERPTYTIENPADRITFNSITNNPNIGGDERDFVNIRETGTNNQWTNDMNVQPGKSYTVRMYVHNNAASNLNLVAENVTAKFNLPTTTGKSIQVNGFLSASNATPQEVYDHASFKSDKNFNLAYQAGTLKFNNNHFGANGTALPESIFTSAGAKLGYDKLDGKIPGCFQYDGYVTFVVKPQFAPESTDFSVNKQVRKDGATDGFKESVAVKPGDKVNYRIEFKNTGNAELKNVMLKDQLPTGMSFVPGTVKLLNANNPGGASIQDGDKLVTTGVNIGSYTPGSNALVVFTAQAKAAAELTCGTTKLTNRASAQPEGKSPKEDTADVNVNKECQPGKIKVCLVDDQRIVEINESEFDKSKHSNNLSDCEKCEVPGKEHLPKNSPDCETAPVTELPQTGLGSAIAAFTGIGALTAGASYYIRSLLARRLAQSE